MKKNSIYAFIIAIGLILSACGSNSKPDGGDNGATTGEITTILQSITVDKNSGNIAANVRVTSTYASSVVATLNSMDISLGGCSLVSGSVSANPDTVTLDSTTPSKDVVLTGTLTDPSCVPTSYQLSGTNTLAVDGQTATRPFTADRVDINTTSIIDGTLKDILTIIDPINKNLDINTSNIEKSVTVHLSQGNTALVNQNVEIVGNVASGSFFASAVSTNDQGNAVFSYTAPATISTNSFDVQFCLVSDHTTCDILTINLTTGTIVTPPDQNETVGDDEINYGITFVSSDGKNTLGINEKKTYTVALINLDTQTVIPDSQVKTITIESKNPDLVKFTVPDSLPVAVREISDRASADLQLRAFTKAGLADMVVTIEYNNTNGYARQLIHTFAITVLSGPPTAFSINSAGVSYNPETKWFEEKFLISASDKDNNPVNLSPTISVNAMAGYAKDNTGNWAVYGRVRKDVDGISGTLTPAGDKAQLEAINIAPFDNFDSVRDYIAVFGGVTTYEANGKWDIDSISGNIASLGNNYAGQSHNDLGFAVGHNYRADACSSEYKEWELKIDSTDGNYKLDDEGKTFVTLKFPPYMMGKQVAIITNFLGKTPETGEIIRSGEVHFQTLSSFDGLKDHVENVAAGTAAYQVTFLMSIDTGTPDVWAYNNGRFTCEVKTTGGPIGVTFIDKFYGTQQGNECWTDAEGFRYGQAWITYELTGGAEDGTFTLENCRVLDEFIF